VVYFGAEREYALRAPGADALSRLGAAVARSVPQLPGCASSGFFTPMGRYYADAGARPEWASIESSDPDDALRSILYGEMLLRSAARDENLELNRSNVDYCGATGACHLNLSCTIDRGIMHDQLLPFFASQVVLGAGGLVPGDPKVAFTMSPRCSCYIYRAVGSPADRERAICQTRNEPLARSTWRIHIAGADTTCCHRGTWLRLATSAAVVWAIESGARPAEIVRLRDTIAAMRMFCADPTFTVTATTLHNTRVTAIDLQRVYLAAVRALIGRCDAPDWLALACQRWQRVLDMLQADPFSVTCVDWCIKFTLFREWARIRHGIDWEALPKFDGPRAKLDRLRDELVELDTRFGTLNPPGLFDQLEESEFDHRVHGVSEMASTGDVPRLGRAAVRAREIIRLSGRHGACCEWDNIFDGQGRVMHLPDAHSTESSWEKEEMSSLMRNSIGLQAARMMQALRRSSARR
jgi:proteasome accessory factor A